MVLGGNDGDAELVFVVEQPHRRFIGCAAGDDQRLTAKVAMGGNPRAALHQELGARHEDRGREGDAVNLVGMAAKHGLWKMPKI